MDDYESFLDRGREKLPESVLNKERFEIPKVPEARVKSGELFQRLSPGYEVSADVNKIGMKERK